MVEPPQETWSHRHSPMGDIACAGGLDSVNLYALRVNWRIPDVSSPQRGVSARIFESFGTCVPSCLAPSPVSHIASRERR
ncbi:protein of unknown function [Streptomyces sp. KY70]|nr:protein of unknown function [Streptomyces sp. KY70]